MVGIALYTDNMSKQMIPVKLTATNSLINQIFDYFNNFSVELGGALGIKDGVISAFYGVRNTDKDRKSYSPSFDDLNAADAYFESLGMSFVGIIHSHPIGSFGSGSSIPSKEDIDFFRSFSETNNDFEYLLFPIITINNNKKVIVWYIWKDDTLKEIDVTTM